MKNLVHSKKFKNFMAKLYGFGAAIVIVGALFKIQHYPGSEILLPVGLLTEAVIFFFSAFEPPHQEPDWTLVYPELAGMYDEELKEELMEGGGRRRGAIGGGNMVGDGVSQELDKMLEDAKIGPELIESLGNSFKTLSENTSKFADISNATVVTEEYLTNVKGASSAVGNLADTYKKTSETLSEDAEVTAEYSKQLKNVSESASTLSGTYNQVSQAIQNDIAASEEYVNSVKSAAESVNELKQKFSESSEKLAATAESIDFSAVDGNSFNHHLQDLTKNIEALNSSYQLQLMALNEQQNKPKEMGDQITEFVNALRNSSEDMQQFKKNIAQMNSMYTQQIESSADQVDKSKMLQEGLAQFIDHVKSSAENTKNFQQELTKLTQNISALNNVYGNMLSAMNVNVGQ